MNSYNMSDEISGLGGLSRKRRTRINSNAGDMGLGVNFFEAIANITKKITNVGKEVQTGVKVVNEIKKVAAGTSFEPPTGIPAGTSIAEPQLRNPTALDSADKTFSIPTSYLLYGGLALAGGLVYLAFRNKQ